MTESYLSFIKVWVENTRYTASVGLGLVFNGRVNLSLNKITSIYLRKVKVYRDSECRFQ